MSAQFVPQLTGRIEISTIKRNQPNPNINEGRYENTLL